MSPEFTWDSRLAEGIRECLAFRCILKWGSDTLTCAARTGTGRGLRAGLQRGEARTEEKPEQCSGGHQTRGTGGRWQEDEGRGQGHSSGPLAQTGECWEGFSCLLSQSGDLKSWDRTGDPALSPQALSLAAWDLFPLNRYNHDYSLSSPSLVYFSILSSCNSKIYIFHPMMLYVYLQK